MSSKLKMLSSVILIILMQNLMQVKSEKEDELNKVESGQLLHRIKKATSSCDQEKQTKVSVNQVIREINGHYFSEAATTYVKLLSNSKSLGTIIRKVFNQTIENNDKVLDFLNHLDSANDKFIGYYYLFSELSSSGQLFTPTGIQLGYNFLNAKKTISADNIYYNNLMEHFPATLRKLPFDKSVKFCYGSCSAIVCDGDRTSAENIDKQCRINSVSNVKWDTTTIDNGLNFNIHNETEYLIAYLPIFLGNFKHVVSVTSDADLIAKYGSWRFYPDSSGNVKILNTYFNEFMYVSSNILYTIPFVSGGNSFNWV